MQEREKTRCKSDMAYHCATHDTQWLDDESDRCEYKRMVDAEAAIARVREKPYLNARPHGQPEPWREGYNQALREVLRALDGDNDA